MLLEKHSREPNALNVWNPLYPAYDFHPKTEIFPVTQEQKLGTRSHQVLLEHSPVVSDQ